MSSYKKRPDFYETEEGQQAKELLKAMVKDTSYSTESSYSADAEHYPDGQIPFVAKHMAYLKNHPATDPGQYLSNLKLMTRKR